MWLCHADGTMRVSGLSIGHFLLISYGNSLDISFNSVIRHCTTKTRLFTRQMSMMVQQFFGHRTSYANSFCETTGRGLCSLIMCRILWTAVTLARFIPFQSMMRESAPVLRWLFRLSHTLFTLTFIHLFRCRRGCGCFGVPGLNWICVGITGAFYFRSLRLHSVETHRSVIRDTSQHRSMNLVVW